jgi:hypothetical protein
MSDPVIALTAGAILNLAFQEFAKVGASEFAKKSLGEAVGLAKTLREKIRTKFKDNTEAKTAVATVETNGSPVALTKMEVYLDDAMADDGDFAQEIQEIANQIVNIQSKSILSKGYNNYGRDQINIETIQGNPKIGGS